MKNKQEQQKKYVIRELISLMKALNEIETQFLYEDNDFFNKSISLEHKSISLTKEIQTTEAQLNAVGKKLEALKCDKFTFEYISDIYALDNLLINQNNKLKSPIFKIIKTKPKK